MRSFRIDFLSLLSGFQRASLHLDCVPLCLLGHCLRSVAVFIVFFSACNLFVIFFFTAVLLCCAVLCAAWAASTSADLHSSRFCFRSAISLGVAGEEIKPSAPEPIYRLLESQVIAHLFFCMPRFTSDFALRLARTTQPNPPVSSSVA
jgi:hypothetical protein